jgi:hypothetical protein
MGLGHGVMRSEAREHQETPVSDRLTIEEEEYD